VWQALLVSVEIAAIATVLTTIAGVALAVLLAWRRLPARDLIDAVVSIPLVLPPTVLGYYLLVVLGAGSPLGDAWEALFGRRIVFNFEGAVIAAAAGSLPLVVRSARLGIEAVDPDLLAAAGTLGASPLRRLFTITLPLAMPGIVAGAMLGFARALGDYGATQMVAGSRIGDTPTASIYIMDQLLLLDDPGVFEMAAATTVLAVGLLYLANRMTRRLRSPHG
jgi:molybdate transport system permease protein